jgi:hypothetical protein
VQSRASGGTDKGRGRSCRLQPALAWVLSRRSAACACSASATAACAGPACCCTRSRAAAARSRCSASSSAALSSSSAAARALERLACLWEPSRSACAAGPAVRVQGGVTVRDLRAQAAQRLEARQQEPGSRGAGSRAPPAPPPRTCSSCSSRLRRCASAAAAASCSGCAAAAAASRARSCASALLSCATSSSASCARASARRLPACARDRACCGRGVGQPGVASWHGLQLPEEPPVLHTELSLAALPAAGVGACCWRLLESQHPPARPPARPAPPLARSPAQVPGSSGPWAQGWPAAAPAAPSAAAAPRPPAPAAAPAGARAPPAWPTGPPWLQPAPAATYRAGVRHAGHVRHARLPTHEPPPALPGSCPVRSAHLLHSRQARLLFLPALHQLLAGGACLLGSRDRLLQLGQPQLGCLRAQGARGRRRCALHTPTQRATCSAAVCQLGAHLHVTMQLPQLAAHTLVLLRRLARLAGRLAVLQLQRVKLPAQLLHLRAQEVG